MKFELNPYNLDVTDQELIVDLIKVTQELGKDYISIVEYSSCGLARFHGNTISRRFHSWNAALEKAGLKVKVRQKASDQELLDDILRIAKQIKPEKLTRRIYDEFGKFSSGPVSKRWGWNNTLKKVNLELNINLYISDIELFKNLEEVWISLGRQPCKRDLVKPISKFSSGPYSSRYGSWRKALEVFVEYINTENDQEQSKDEFEITELPSLVIDYKHKTKREINNRLKVLVLMRDIKNGLIKCALCGLPLTGLEIHYDHIIPWSRGGETELENIQILCKPHNLAKGNVVL